MKSAEAATAAGAAHSEAGTEARLLALLDGWRVSAGGGPGSLGLVPTAARIGYPEQQCRSSQHNQHQACRDGAVCRLQPQVICQKEQQRSDKKAAAGAQRRKLQRLPNKMQCAPPSLALLPCNVNHMILLSESISTPHPDRHFSFSLA